MFSFRSAVPMLPGRYASQFIAAPKKRSCSVNKSFVSLLQEAQRDQHGLATLNEELSFNSEDTGESVHDPASRDTSPMLEVGWAVAARHAHDSTMNENGVRSECQLSASPTNFLSRKPLRRRYCVGTMGRRERRGKLRRTAEHSVSMFEERMSKYKKEDTESMQTSELRKLEGKRIKRDMTKWVNDGWRWEGRLLGAWEEAQRKRWVQEGTQIKARIDRWLAEGTKTAEQQSSEVYVGNATEACWETEPTKQAFSGANPSPPVGIPHSLPSPSRVTAPSSSSSSPVPVGVLKAQGWEEVATDQAWSPSKEFCFDVATGTTFARSLKRKSRRRKQKDQEFSHAHAAAQAMAGHAQAATNTASTLACEEPRRVSVPVSNPHGTQRVPATFSDAQATSPGLLPPSQPTTSGGGTGWAPGRVPLIPGPLKLSDSDNVPATVIRAMAQAPQTRAEEGAVQVTDTAASRPGAAPGADASGSGWRVRYLSRVLPAEELRAQLRVRREAEKRAQILQMVDEMWQ